MKKKKDVIQVLLVDDHSMVREGLKVLLKRYKDIHVCGEAANGEEALVKIKEEEPDVVLMDIRLPDMDGILACEKALSLGCASSFLMLTSFSDEGLVLRAIRAGARGFVLKEIDPEGLRDAILKVHRGEVALHQEAIGNLTQDIQSRKKDGSDLLSQGLATLSTQETKVMRLVAEGLINKEIASEMGLAEKTIKNYLAHIFEKLGVNRRAQVAVIYSEHLAGKNSTETI
jgi:DNA-binding NarL/FixJ family response regulator